MDQLPHLISEIEILVNRGALPEAAARAADLSQMYPKSFMLWNILGVLRMQTNDAKGAALALRHATGIAPQSAEGQVNYGSVLCQLGRFSEAVECYRKGHHPASGLRRRLEGAFGEAWRQKGALMRAAEALEQAARLLPDDAETHHLLGSTLNNLGQVDRAVVGAGAFEAAEKEYRAALRLDPDHAEAYRLLSGVKRFQPEDPDLGQMLDLYSRVDARSEARCQICFALATAFEETGAVARAFAFLQEGDALRKARLGYDTSYDERDFARLRAGVRGLLGSGTKIVPAGYGPVSIFIVGMPRSGTMLVEQILSSHSDVMGAGELPFVPQLGEALACGTLKATCGRLEEFRKAYLERLSRRAAGRGHFIDKIPENFKYCGLIAEVFLGAKIIHLHRDARAVCWSNYRQYFTTRGLGCCYDMADTVAYHALHRDLMAQWMQSYPDRIHDLDYEALTEAQEPDTRRLLAAVGLPWEDQCLRPEDNFRAVLTASSRQHRQGVYRGSSAKWRDFAPFIGPLLDGLGAAAV